MHETGVVLVNKDDVRDCRGAYMKRIVVAAVECVSVDGG